MALAVQNSSFSLVEVTLALMVVSIGILCILGLFSVGLDQNARGRNETHAALFAEEIFSTYRRFATTTNWHTMESQTNAPVESGAAWVTLPSLRADSSTNLMRYVRDDNTNITQYALRYCLRIATNSIDVPASNLVKSATLCVWSGEFGTSAAPIVFYTEYFNFRP